MSLMSLANILEIACDSGDLFKILVFCLRAHAPEVTKGTTPICSINTLRFYLCVRLSVTDVGVVTTATRATAS